ncbi:MAG: hypothetical protein AAF826_00135 [Pseudomonadota bacterium]
MTDFLHTKYRHSEYSEQLRLKSSGIAVDPVVLNNTIGCVAVGLPPILATSMFFESSCMRDSVSHFYYAVFYGDLFVGAMFFIGAFLLAFKGETWLDTVLAKLAGIGAFGTALFPAKGGGCSDGEFASRLFAQVIETDLGLNMQPHVGATDLGFFQLVGTSHLLHSFFAILLTGFLAYYSLCVFTRVRRQDICPVSKKILPEKKRMNRVFRTAGGAIIFAILAMSYHVLSKDLLGTGIPYWDQMNGSFIAETIAMSAFGIGWMLKIRSSGKSPLDSAIGRYPNQGFAPRACA